MGSRVWLTGTVPTGLGGAVGGSCLKGVSEGGIIGHAAHGCCHAPVQVQCTKAGGTVLCAQVAEQATSPAAKLVAQAQAGKSSCSALWHQLRGRCWRQVIQLLTGILRLLKGHLVGDLAEVGWHMRGVRQARLVGQAAWHASWRLLVMLWLVEVMEAVW